MSVIIRGYPDLLPVGENFINLSDFNVMIDKHLIVTVAGIICNLHIGRRSTDTKGQFIPLRRQAKCGLPARQSKCFVPYAPIHVTILRCDPGAVHW